MNGVKKGIHRLVRGVHVSLLDRGLPERVALVMHNVTRLQYGAFEEMIVYFRDQGYLVTAPEQYLSPTTQERALLLSCDDNYEGWHTALPFFERLRTKMTFYVNTLPLRGEAEAGAIAAYYERINLPPSVRPLSRHELRELAAQGHTIGSHTHSHQMLTALPVDAAHEEIRRGKAVLEEILGQSVFHFAYPFGMARHFSESLRDYCRMIGFQTIANATSGLLHIPQLPLSINRSGWDLERSLQYNLQGIRAHGAWFAQLTGRSAV